MNPKQAKELGSFLRQGREQSSISVRGLAGLVGVDKAQILRLEDGEVASPKADLLGRICDELSLPLADVLALAGYPTTRQLPSLRPYMRAKYRDLPPEALDEVQTLVERLTQEHRSRGPIDGEDEH